MIGRGDLPLHGLDVAGGNRVRRTVRPASGRQVPAGAIRTAGARPAAATTWGRYLASVGRPGPGSACRLAAGDAQMGQQLPGNSDAYGGMSKGRWPVHKPIGD